MDEKSRSLLIPETIRRPGQRNFPVPNSYLNPQIRKRETAPRAQRSQLQLLKTETRAGHTSFSKYKFVVKSWRARKVKE